MYQACTAQICGRYCLRPYMAGWQECFRAFGRKMKGYYAQMKLSLHADLAAPSSVRIPRDPDTLMHPQVKGLSCGLKVQGMPGGIVSAAMDEVKGD